MDTKEDLVKKFAKYCAQCHGMCCKRGVFSVFKWEEEKLSHEFKNFQDGHIADTRGTCKDISINNLCMFSKENGCRLPVRLRPTDCLTYPFYPKPKVTNGKLRIEEFAIAKECSFYKEIAKDKPLIEEVSKYWNKFIKQTTYKEITDWIGVNGNWHDWYKNSIEVKCKSKNKYYGQGLARVCKVTNAR